MIFHFSFSEVKEKYMANLHPHTEEEGSLDMLSGGLGMMSCRYSFEDRN